MYGWTSLSASDSNFECFLGSICSIGYSPRIGSCLRISQCMEFPTLNSCHNTCLPGCLWCYFSLHLWHTCHIFRQLRINNWTLFCFSWKICYSFLKVGYTCIQTRTICTHMFLVHSFCSHMFVCRANCWFFHPNFRFLTLQTQQICFPLCFLQIGLNFPPIAAHLSLLLPFLWLAPFTF